MRQKKLGEVVMRGTPFETWCKVSGDRGEKLLEEFADPQRGPMDVTYGSNKKVSWTCVKCGWGWYARPNSRTSSGYPSGCPACSGHVATETNNLRLTCEESGGQLKHLFDELNHPTMRMEEFTPLSYEKVPWKCGECGCEWEAKIGSRAVRSKAPTGCPECNRAGRRHMT